MTEAPVHGAAAARRAAAAVRRVAFQPAWGVVLGSGFDQFHAALTDCTAIPYGEIPGMPSTSVAGHRGVLHQGWLDSTPLAVLEGRLHTYEGHDATTATFPIRLLAALGIQSLFLTNAAGGVDPALHAGSLMLIRDHINLPALTGNNPLRGSEDEQLTRFVAMRDAYTVALRLRAQASALRLGIDLAEGVYAMVSGPSYETPAEVQFLRAVGAHAVGMSTAGEVIVARQLSLSVLGISCIANAAHGETEGDVQHGDVLAEVRRQVPTVLALFRDVLAQR